MNSQAGIERNAGARVGVDAGGTFTDVCLIGGDGTFVVYKLASTPADPSEAIVAGAAHAITSSGNDARAISYFGHGTTVATNAILERRGATTGLITTAGFRDLLEIGRQERPDLYDLQTEKPVPLVRRRDRLEAGERMRHDGTVERPLDEDAVRSAIRTLRDQGIESVAVCFLYSYLYPEHERRVGELLAEELPGAYVSLSHRVLAEFREYERLSSTVVNAFIGPAMARYVEHLRERVAEMGIPSDPYITQSNGGLISLDVARELPVRTALSGPAAGVVGATRIAGLAGYDNIITFDMGGTSTDVALIEDGRTSLSLDMKIAGYPIRTPMIDINTVGAGGGSVAWIDRGGHLKVGPRSAGAVPGPAGYGRGGDEATVTDANIALGILNRVALLDGRLKVDSSASDSTIATLAAELGMEPVDVAQGVLSVVTANMARAIRVISIERGYDPRDFALVAFGGAGPLHAARLARELEIPKVIVPTYPGILCALGLLVSDLRSDFSRTLIRPAETGSLDEVNEALTELERESAAWLDREKISESQRRVSRVADMRYAGQNYELAIDLPDSWIDEQGLAQVLETFHQEHERAYGFAAPGEPAQFVTLRVEARGEVPPPRFTELPRGEGAAQPETVRTAYIPEAGGWIKCPVYRRDALLGGQHFYGPAVVDQMDATTLVLPGQRVQVDPIGNLIISDESEGNQ